MALAPGTQAPDFKLKSPGSDGFVDVALSDTRGKANTVLLFFPAAFSSVCTTELCDATNGLGGFEAADAKVYGISVDSPFALKAWAEKFNIKVPLLSDFSREVTRAYGVELPDFAGTGGAASNRAVFVIDKQGKVVYSQVTPNPGELPDMAPVTEALQSLS
ncbi:MAG: redoxin domain-containing protein [Fimbriimonadaceae bacterium]|nr:redoxin domain-containing protein [Fimbriimonadaceae bacterium]QYK55193.1 MAG: redoxin domain-containing protein [Fimbriimonadaceae bacterium]